MTGEAWENGAVGIALTRCGVYLGRSVYACRVVAARRAAGAGWTAARAARRAGHWTAARLETVTQLVTLLAASSAAGYAVGTILVLTRRWNISAGSRTANVASVVAFAAARIVPQSAAAAAIASLACVIALLAIVRHSSSVTGGVLTAVPIAAMLLVVDRPFFSDPVAAQFQTATIALLCAAGPVAIARAAISRQRET